jgi:cyclopropane fatty-acyl-phospholipid synthase-like methyltransferase
MSNRVFYDRDFYQDQVAGSLQSAREVIPAVVALVQPRSVVDVGCGMGTWLSVLREHGVEDVMGLDGEYVDREKLLIPRDRFVARDLTKDFELERKFDLVMSLEVAEHLYEEFAEGFVKSLVSLGETVLFSAAIPGQGGTHHVNERWPEYWRNLFAGHGYVPIDCLRHRLWNNRKIQVCYRQNIMLYVSEGRLQSSPALLNEKALWDDYAFSLVHPDMLQECLKRPPTLRTLIKALPNAVSEAFKQRWSRLQSGD